MKFITKLKLAWHVLRGRPLVYRVRFHNGVQIDVGTDSKVVECEFINGGVEFGPGETT